MKRIDIMTDIETLGHKTDSTIIQISAVAFDINQGDFVSSFNRIADITKNDNLKATGSTLKWWLNTDKELLTELINSGEGSSEDILKDFHKWILKLIDLSENVYLWGNGILFDNKMIQHQMESVGLEYPIHYKNDRDVRTIIDLASAKTGLSEKEIKEKFLNPELKEHNAYDDVIYQINIVLWCYEQLIGKER